MDISSSLWSKLVSLYQVLEWSVDNSVWACLGTGTWAFLAWPLACNRVGEDESTQYSFKLADGAATWHFVTDPNSYTVILWEPVRACATEIRLKGIGRESLPKAALRRNRLLGFDDLCRLADWMGIAGAGDLSRDGLLNALAEAIAPGDDDYKQLVVNPKDEVEGLDLLADDPMVEATFDELDPDDKQELSHVKKALDKKKISAHHATRGMKRTRDGQFRRRPKAKAKAKAKAAGAPTPSAPPAVVPPAPAPPVHPAVEPPVPAPPEPPAVVLPVPPAVAPSVRGRYGKHYKYIEIPDVGDLVFSERMRKMNAHCLCAGHQTTKCHMDRTIPETVCYNAAKFKGRFVGFHLAWLHSAAPDKACHDDLKKTVGDPIFVEERRSRRAELWARRHDNPDINELFALEVPPPADYVGEPELWEPDSVF